MFRRAAAAALVVFRLYAQSSTALEYTGTPLRLPFTCDRGDLQEFGLSCSPEEPCSIFLELSAIESAGTRIFAVGDLHTRETTLYSVLLASADSGHSWTEPQKRLRASALDGVQFLDFETGWVSGANLEGVPHDPFFLTTEDAGATWHYRPVFDDERAGSVERFRFDSKSSGALLLDAQAGGVRQLYITMTGGDNWSLRQTGSKGSITFPKGPTSFSPWRIRADGKNGAYRIEKETGETWRTVASFLIETAKCTE